MEHLALEEYKALGEAIGQANKNLKLIQKFIVCKNIEFNKTSSENFVDLLSNVMCDLINLSSSLEDQMDEAFCNDFIETIDFFN